jgi:predicted MFS family arabinose efflux permease
MDIVLKIIFLLHFFNDGIKITISSLLPFIKKDIHLTFTQIGLLGAASGITTVILAIPMGILAARINGIKIIFLCLLAYSLCAFGISHSSSFVALLLFFYLAGTSFAPFHIVGQSSVVRATKKESIGRAISALSMAGDTGRVMLPPIALYIVTLIGWRDTYVTISSVGLTLFFILLFLLRNKHYVFNKKTTMIPTESTKDWVKHFLRILQKKELLLVILGGVFDGIGGSAVYLFLPFLFLAQGIPQSLLFLFVGAYFIGSLAGRKLFGKAIDVYGPAKVFILAEIVMAVLLLFLTHLHNPIFIFIVTFILGFFTRGTVPVVTTLFAVVSHVAHYEKTFAHGEIFLGAASVISPLALGRMADTFGIATTFYLGAALAVTAVIPIYFFTRIHSFNK